MAVNDLRSIFIFFFLVIFGFFFSFFINMLYVYDESIYYLHFIINLVYLQKIFFFFFIFIPFVFWTFYVEICMYAHWLVSIYRTTCIFVSINLWKNIFIFFYSSLICFCLIDKYLFWIFIGHWRPNHKFVFLC